MERLPGAEQRQNGMKKSPISFAGSKMVKLWGGVPLERFWNITISTTGLHDRCFASFAFCAGLSIHQSNGSKHKTGAKLQLATIRVTVTVFSATPLPLMKIS